MDNSKHEGSFVYFKYKGWLKFSPNSLGLHACDVMDGISKAYVKNVNNNLKSCSLLHAVDSNASNVITIEIRQANEAKSIYKRMGGLTFKNIACV